MNKRKLTALVCFLTLTLITIGLYSHDYHQQKSTQIKKPLSAKDLKPKIKMVKMERQVISTEANGQWFWRVYFKNTGNVKFAKNTIGASGVLIRKNGGRIASPMYPFDQELPPKGKGSVKINFDRCCDAKEFQFTLHDLSASPPKRLDGATTVTVPHLGVYVAQLSWKRVQFPNRGQWTVKVKNPTARAIKITIQALALPKNITPLRWKGAGGATKVIPARGEVIQKGTYHCSYKVIQNPLTRRRQYVSGDRLKVELRFFHNKTRCGGTSYCIRSVKEIVIK